MTVHNEYPQDDLLSRLDRLYEEKNKTKVYENLAALWTRAINHKKNIEQ